MPSKVLVAASTKPLVLSVLTHGRNYGYRIIKEIEVLSEGQLQWTDAMLYPVLKRMENEELITSHWVETDTGRKRKYYEITALGKERLAADRAEWVNVNRIFSKLWTSPTDSDLITE